MKNRNTIICVIGTRPEAIKMAPVIRALQATTWARCIVVATAQHRDLLDQMLRRFGVSIDHDLDLMQDGQRSSELLARMLPSLEKILIEEAPSAVLAQGDTTTVFGAAIAAYHCRIPFGHVEAGLRTGNLDQPFPEEGYRQMVSRIAKWHFAPTQRAAATLVAEQIPAERIYITGNTCIDTLLQTTQELGLSDKIGERIILLTAHRRENFGAPLISVFNAILQIADRFTDVKIMYPVHPNPNVQVLAQTMLSKHPRIKLLKPLDYFDFVQLMNQSMLILTDSGGIQEEAPTLGKPVMVLRDTTERPEAVEAGVACLVGTDTLRITTIAGRLLEDEVVYKAMAQKVSPYGDGHASKKIVEAIRMTVQKNSV